MFGRKRNMFKIFEKGGRRSKGRSKDVTGGGSFAVRRDKGEVGDPAGHKNLREMAGKRRFF